MTFTSTFKETAAGSLAVGDHGESSRGKNSKTSQMKAEIQGVHLLQLENKGLNTDVTLVYYVKMEKEANIQNG